MLSRATLMWAVLAVTAPCPVFVLLCGGLLPPAAIAGVIARALVRHPLLDGIVAVALAAELALLLWLLRWVARRMVARVPARGLAVAAAGLILVSLAPIYFFECMDSSQLTRCSVPDMLQAAVTEGRQCGDLGW